MMFACLFTQRVFQPKYISGGNLVLMLTHETVSMITLSPPSLSPSPPGQLRHTQYIYCKYHLLYVTFDHTLQFSPISLSLHQTNVKAGPGHEPIPGLTEQMRTVRMIITHCFSLIFALMWWPVDPGRYQAIFPTLLCSNTSMIIKRVMNGNGQRGIPAKNRPHEN